MKAQNYFQSIEEIETYLKEEKGLSCYFKEEKQIDEEISFYFIDLRNKDVYVAVEDPEIDELVELLKNKGFSELENSHICKNMMYDHVGHFVY